MPYSTDYIDKELVESIYEENKLRIKKMLGDHDQYSGYGIEGHNNECVILDYPIKTQYLTDEVYNNQLYQQVMKYHSIDEFIFNMNRQHGVKLTKDMVVNELFFTRCSRDPSFAFYTTFKIKSKTDGMMIPFKLNYAQRYILSILEDMRIKGKPIRLILLKARQWGGSTLVQLYIAWIQLFIKEGWYSVIIAQTKDTAKRIKAMYKKVLDEIPAFMFGVQQLQFLPYEKSVADSIIADETGNKLRDNVITVASYENFETTRGMDYAMAHFSEVAYWKDTKGKSAEEVVRNLDNNILEQPLTIEVMESTANGMNGFFYDEYKLAKEGKSSRKAVFIPFYYIENDMSEFRSTLESKRFIDNLLRNKDIESAPDETSESGRYLYSLWEKGATLEHIKWYIEKRKSVHDHTSIASEAPSDDVECFKFSGHHVFNTYVIDIQREKYKSVPEFKGEIFQPEDTLKFNFVKDANGLFRIWKHPDSNKTTNQYIVVVDVGGRSDGADYSVITVIDRWGLRFTSLQLEVVARWHGHIRYDYLAYKAVKIARYYKNALLVFESNTFDKKRSDASEFVESGDHIRGILNKIGDVYSNLYMRTATDVEDIRSGIYKKIGFQTNRKTKQDMVDNFIVEFEDDKFIDHDERFYAEAGIYEQRPDGSYGNAAGKGNHDDILMTNMIGALISKEMPKPDVARNDTFLYGRRESFSGASESSF